MCEYLYKSSYKNRKVVIEMAAEGERREYYDKIRSESLGAIAATLPTVVLMAAAAILIHLFGRLVFIPIAEGLYFYGWPMPQLLNFIIMVALALVILKIFIDVRRLVGGLGGYVACAIGAPYDVSPEEVEHYRTALIGIFNIIVVSLAYLLFAEFLSGIHPGLSGVVLLAIVIWAIFQIWRVVQAVSAEIRRYTSQWTERILRRS